MGMRHKGGTTSHVVVRAAARDSEYAIAHKPDLYVIPYIDKLYAFPYKTIRKEVS